MKFRLKQNPKTTRKSATIEQLKAWEKQKRTGIDRSSTKQDRIAERNNKKSFFFFFFEERESIQAVGALKLASWRFLRERGNCGSSKNLAGRVRRDQSREIIWKRRSEPLIKFSLYICFVSWGCVFKIWDPEFLGACTFENIPFLCYIT